MPRYDDGAAPRRHHLDRRAAEIAARAESLPDDALIDTRTLADWLDVSTQWAEIGRHRGYGPPYIRLSPRRIRYRAGDVRVWLSERSFRGTAEYA